MATTKSEPSKFQRAAQYDQFGKNLDSVAERDMVLHRYSVGTRNIRDRETKGVRESSFVNVYLTEVDAPEDTEPVSYHAWSDSLAEKLAQIPDDAMPLLIKFVRVPTAGGFRVWTFE